MFNNAAIVSKTASSGNKASVAGFFGFIKSIVVPVSIALLLYLISIFFLPLIRRYYSRYSQYVPLPAVSAGASSLRGRVSDALMHFILPISWRRRAQGEQGQTRRGNSTDSEEGLFNEEEGEGMVGFDVNAGRREQMPSAALADSERRLSRDLEEGFRDDSGDEAEAEPPPTTAPGYTRQTRDRAWISRLTSGTTMTTQ